MHPDNTIDKTTVPNEPVEQATDTATEAQPRQGFQRRTFLKAAALGTAAAAFANRSPGGNVRFGPLSAYADDMSALQCTANDVRVIGPGVIVNEPCDCTGTFNAQVQFTVENNAAAPRYCVTLHVCPTTLANGQVFAPGDIVLGDIAGKTTKTFTTTINNYPCGQGLLCFGAAGPEQFGVFPKGAACPSGQCCSTITYNVKASDPCPDTTRQIGSKCRHQQICIQGRGNTTLDCDTGASGIQRDCTVPCGGTTTLRLCTTGGPAPYTFKLEATGQATQTRTSSNLCETFTVSVSEDTTFTGTVTDSGSPKCSDTDSVLLRVSDISITVDAVAPDCAGGETVITALPAGLANYQFSIDDGTAIDNGASNELSIVLAPGTHTIDASATNEFGCPATASTTVTVPTAVTLTDITRSAGCDGVVSLSATADGGTPPYTFIWKVNNATQNSGIASSNGGKTSTLTLQPLLDGSCRSVAVSVTDDKGCGPAAKTNSLSQCVTTSNC